MTPQNRDYFVFIGTYTRTSSEGIYVYRMDAATGALAYVSSTPSVEPSFLALEPQQRYLYAVNEVNDFGGRSSGAVSAFSINRSTGALTPLNQQPTLGPGPCHLCVDATGKYVIVANYQGGSLCVLPIQDGGSLGEASDFIQHQGSSVNPERQKEPHAHSVTLDSANRYLMAADLGIDRVMIYRLDLSRGKLVPNDTPFVQVKAGYGPRHFDFHLDGRFAYLINELGCTITAFAYDAAQGRLAQIESVPTLPPSFAEMNHTADIHVHPSGRFVYGSNRGHDSIVIYSIDSSTGRLSYVGHEPTHGNTPRNFGIDPTGTYLLAANQNSDTIVTFRIDQQTGRLTATGDVAQVPMPVCLKFMPVS